ncbi:hypothetical protein V497_08918 [Pseudogymnoascus sp. VKM F-4516 (FW-969)]|nr:hypothetical protein V497_08918 [Pseudogymnoascus sp. VKM F-4516 (FW-969)]
MVTFTRFLLVSLHLLSRVYADDDSTSEALEWLEAERSVLVHLPTPDLSFLVNQMPSPFPGAFIFNFTLTPNNLTLLLNGEPILPRAHPYIPTPLRAYQTIETPSDSGSPSRTNTKGALALDLDYYIDGPDTTSGTSIYNTRYDPRLRIDILRASTPAHSTPLSSDSQHQIWIWLEDLTPHPPGTPYASIALRIKRVQVGRRWRNRRDSEGRTTQGTTTYRDLASLNRCYLWSWLCADIREYPYYQFIYREKFDQYGKKGSMRHFLTWIWGALVGVVGFGPAIVLAVIWGIVMFTPVVYGVIIRVKRVVGMYQRRAQEVDEWVADEEVEGLLRYDTYVEDSTEIVIEKEVSEEKGERKRKD